MYINLTERRVATRDDQDRTYEQRTLQTKFQFDIQCTTRTEPLPSTTRLMYRKLNTIMH